MAASKFFTYNTAVKHILAERIKLASGALYAVLMTDGYTPSTASDSSQAQLTAFQASASSTIVNAIALSNVVVTGSGVETVKLVADNLSGFSADGSTITSAKYVGVYDMSASYGGVDGLALGYLNLDASSASASAGNTTQVNVTWPSGGIFKWRSNQ